MCGIYSKLVIKTPELQLVWKWEVFNTGQVRKLTPSTQPAFGCSKLTLETLEQGLKYVQS